MTVLSRASRRCSAQPAASASSTRLHEEVSYLAGCPRRTPVYLCRLFPPPDLVARAVLVDMEPKVIRQSISKANRSGRWRYGEASYFCQNQGSGNNWANG